MTAHPDLTDMGRNGAIEINGFTRAQIQLFAIRCCDLAERIEAGQIGFLDAIDLAFSAGVWSGLVESVGDDAIQKIMAAAFARSREPAP